MTAATLTPADRALTDGFAGDLEGPGRDFLITIHRPGQAPEVLKERFPTSWDALVSADERFGHDADGAAERVKLDIRPVIEVTESEGYSRWPQPLHADAFGAAVRGWNQARLNAGRPWHVVQAEQASTRNCDRALARQMDRPDELSRICMGD